MESVGQFVLRWCRVCNFLQLAIMMMITMVVRVGGWWSDSPAPWDAGGEVPQLPGMLAEYFPSSLGRWRSPL